MKLHIQLFLLTSLISTSLLSMEQSSQGLTVYAIPGQNRSGSEIDYVEQVLQRDDQNHLELIQVGTPTLGADLGQNNCIKLLSNKVKEVRTYKNAIIYATSQGTATALNYIAQTQNKKSENKIDGLVLEATLSSGNSAILHTVAGPIGLDLLTRLPFSYYWIPYLAKIRMPLYWPGGKQPIKSIERIPTDLPIIIMHSDSDREIPFSNACALYYGLRNAGNNNVYLLPFKGAGHIQILNGHPQAAQIVREILTKHTLLKKEQTIKNFSRFQPDPEHFKANYDALIAREKWHERLKYVLGTGACAASAIAIKALCTKYGLL